MAIIIKKKVSLDFLGEEYKDASLTFQSIPIKDIDELQTDVAKSQEDNKAATFILNTLKKYFVEGVFPGVESVTKEDLDGLDSETVIKCFSQLTGQDIDPKSEGQSTKPSSTDQTPQ